MNINKKNVFTYTLKVVKEKNEPSINNRVKQNNNIDSFEFMIILSLHNIIIISQS